MNRRQLFAGGLTASLSMLFPWRAQASSIASKQGFQTTAVQLLQSHAWPCGSPDTYMSLTDEQVTQVHDACTVSEGEEYMLKALPSIVKWWLFHANMDGTWRLSIRLDRVA